MKDFIDAQIRGIVEKIEAIHKEYELHRTEIRRRHEILSGLEHAEIGLRSQADAYRTILLHMKEAEHAESEPSGSDTDQADLGDSHPNFDGNDATPECISSGPADQ